MTVWALGGSRAKSLKGILKSTLVLAQGLLVPSPDPQAGPPHPLGPVEEGKQARPQGNGLLTHAVLRAGLNYTRSASPGWPDLGKKPFRSLSTQSWN